MGLIRTYFENCICTQRNTARSHTALLHISQEAPSGLSHPLTSHIDEPFLHLPFSDHTRHLQNCDVDSRQWETSSSLDELQQLWNGVAEYDYCESLGGYYDEDLEKFKKEALRLLRQFPQFLQFHLHHTASPSVIASANSYSNREIFEVADVKDKVSIHRLFGTASHIIRFEDDISSLLLRTSTMKRS